jgi:acyl phosphate:glycerol-3-phosphate acyltransferase
MELIALPLSAALGYLLGSIPFGLVIVKAAGLGDIREMGSGNIGATNVLRTGRKDLALATFLLDSGKAAIALALARHFFGDTAGFVAGAAAFLGHCFPVWLNFKGGKGVATFFGVLLVGLPIQGLAAGAIWLLCAIFTRYSSLGSLMAALSAPITTYLLRDPGDWIVPVGFCVLLCALIFWRHRTNIERLAAGTEPRIGAKSKGAKSTDAEPV